MHVGEGRLKDFPEEVTFELRCKDKWESLGSVARRGQNICEENRPEAPVAAAQKVGLVQGQRGGQGPDHERPMEASLRNVILYFECKRKPLNRSSLRVPQ